MQNNSTDLSSLRALLNDIVEGLIHPGCIFVLLMSFFFVYLWGVQRRIKRRRYSLTASKFAGAAGISPFQSREDTWREVTQRTPIVPETEFAKQAKSWGIQNEAVARDVYCSLVNTEVHVPTTRYSHPKYTWLSGIPDGLIYDGEGKLEGILEIKCRYPRNLHLIDTTVPYQTMSQIFYYIPQIQGYMELVNCNYADLLSYTPKGSTVFRIYRDREYWDLLLPVLVEFYRYLESDSPPPAQHPNTKELIERSKSIYWQTLQEAGVIE